MEDEEIYLDFFTIFQKAFGFSMTQYLKVAESDQGGPLKTAVEKLGMRYIFCLRHLLVSLGRTEFSFQVGNLVSSKCQKNYDEFKQIYEKSWNSISDEKTRKELKRILKNVGLEFSEDQNGETKKKHIEIENQN